MSAKSTYVVIPVDGDIYTVETTTEDSYETITREVGGWIQVVGLTVDEQAEMYLDEEGKIKNLPRNTRATSIAHLMSGDYIAGTAVITGGVDDEGDTVGLTPEQVQRLLSL